MRQIRWIFPTRPKCNPDHEAGEDDGKCPGRLVYQGGSPNGRMRYARCNKCKRVAKIIALGREIEDEAGRRSIQ